MAVINVSYDTKTKKFNATIDGAQLLNVESIDIYKSYDNPKESHIDVRMRQEIEGEDIVVFTNVTASKKDMDVRPIEDYRVVDKAQLTKGAYTLMGR